MRASALSAFWPRRRSADPDWFEASDIDRAQVFVPAIMSVGLVFSAVTLVRDLLRWSGGRARERRTAIEAGAVLSRLLNEDEPEPRELGILSRPSYLVSAIALVGGAAYVAIGSTANFLRDGGYVRDISWLLSISLGLAVVLGFLGGVSLVVFWSWPQPPPWALASLRTAPLTITPGRQQLGPSWARSAWLGATALTTGVITLMVGTGRGVARQIDEPILLWAIEATWIDRLQVIDFFGRTQISIVFVLLIGLASFRCRVMALAYPIAFLASWSLTAFIRELIDRPRPSVYGNLESFPSGHLVQATFIAGLVPLALWVLFLDKRLAAMSRFLLVIGVVATAIFRVHAQHHWPLDSLAGVTLGLTVVLATHWSIEHSHWHRRCSACPWSGHPSHVEWDRGLFEFSPPTLRRVGLLGALGALAASGALALAVFVVGLPTDPESRGVASSISSPSQLGLLILLAVAGLLALAVVVRSWPRWWRAVAAVLMAFSAVGLGLFAAVQYQSAVSFTLAIAVLMPAVLTWLAWQPTETLGTVAGLAVATTALLSGTVMGSIEVYDHYYGPTHPASLAPAPDFAEAEWLWLGGVGPTSATVVAGGLDAGEPVVLRYWPSEEVIRAQSVGVVADDGGVARFELTGLEPGGSVSYSVEEEEELVAVPLADAGFTTPEVGAQDLVIVSASCARVGSNGAVFDQMRAEDPDLFVSLGDMHYGDLASSDPADHLAQYGVALTQPGQAALYSSVPTAYIWDDHDYGPNNADGSSPSRPAVSQAYRQAVPHHGVDPDPEASIAQAFTVGRVRVVMSDSRSQRSADTMLGDDQLAWLIDELTRSARTHALVVWANSVPWISAESADSWGAYPDERRRIADALAEAGVQNLVMVSGDAHMVAIDDGTNSGYSSAGTEGFPVLHGAALDRPGSVKGGPYSHGAFPGSGQYGRLEIDDDGGDTIEVTLSGKTWDGRELTSLSFTVDVPPGA